MLKLLSMYKTNAALRPNRAKMMTSVSMAEVRKMVPMAVIDDDVFTPKSNLMAHGYKIDELGDIKRLEEVRDYRIVLCDLMGVGQYFDTVRQGASLIEEIRMHYPATLVVAYSGSRPNSAPARDAKFIADETLRKDADIGDWRNVLDDLIKDAIDPYFVWQRIRERLVEIDVDTKDILALEDGYVRTVLARDRNGTALRNVSTRSSIPGEVKNIISGVISSVLAGVLFGV